LRLEGRTLHSSEFRHHVTDTQNVLA
jgi:hypothetical protein